MLRKKNIYSAVRQTETKRAARVSYVFVLFVVLVLSLVLTVVLGHVDGAAGQISQKVLDQKSGFTELLSDADVELRRPVS